MAANITCQQRRWETWLLLDAQAASAGLPADFSRHDPRLDAHSVQQIDAAYHQRFQQAIMPVIRVGDVD